MERPQGRRRTESHVGAHHAHARSGGTGLRVVRGGAWDEPDAWPFAVPCLVFAVVQRYVFMAVVCSSCARLDLRARVVHAGATTSRPGTCVAPPRMASRSSLGCMRCLERDWCPIK